MRTALTVAAAGLVFGLGYLMGTMGALRPDQAVAQEPPAAGQPAPGQPAPLSDDARTKIKAAADALKAAMEALQLEQRYNPATKGINAFAILSGGSNSRNELEAGAGVDPETYAALYAGLAVDEIQEKIGVNVRNQLTYNGKPVAMISRKHLRAMYSGRAAITGEELPGLPKPGAEPAKKEEKKEEKKEDKPEEKAEEKKE